MAFMRKTASSYRARWQNTEASGLRARESAAGCSDEERTLVMALVFLVWRRKEAVQRGSASLTVAQRSGSVELDSQVWGWWNVTQWHFRAIGFDLEENTHTHTHVKFLRLHSLKEENINHRHLSPIFSEEKQKKISLGWSMSTGSVRLKRSRLGKFLVCDVQACVICLQSCTTE